MNRDIGIALSGGGSRAAAFHLGCLRALDDRGLLYRARVISGVSGGALLAGLYAYGPVDFQGFDEHATALLRDGLQRAVVQRLLLSGRLVEAMISLAGVPFAAVTNSVARLGSTEADRARSGPERIRHFNRTTAFADVLTNRVFGDRRMSQVSHAGLDVVLTACDLGTGAAVRFGSRVSSCSRIGTIVDEIKVAEAVVASAAYPAFLPALEQRYRFRRHGEEFDRVMLLTDGGVYDNLGLSALEVDRDESYTPHVYDIDYVIACDAGQGQLRPAAPHFWPWRMKRVVDIMHGRAQHGERGRLYAAQASGRLCGFVYAYLGMQDERLPVPMPDLVPRNRVARYKTNFRAMPADDLDALATRGEQLVRTLLAHYCPSLA